MKSVRIITQSEKEDVNSPKIGIFWFVPANIIDENPVLLYGFASVTKAFWDYARFCSSVF
ncbi:MAG: hypothetical protein MR350_04495 [Alphaproteobacteria bacterium]|nr:hypothetical protein [Alphaproteobacteria bacterium]